MCVSANRYVSLCVPLHVSIIKHFLDPCVSWKLR